MIGSLPACVQGPRSRPAKRRAAGTVAVVHLRAVNDHVDLHLDPEVAAAYDHNHADRFRTEDLEPTIERLRSLADGGKTVEFAIGTGRVGLPLMDAGVEVHGIDLSEPMVAELRAKPGGADLPVTIGDMTRTVVGHDFSLAYLVFNTIGNVTTQAGQVACFENAARHLRPGGRFVIECLVPILASLPPGQTVAPFAVTEDYVGFDEYFDHVNQLHSSHHWRADGDHLRRVVGTFRWVWPSELDLMARLAGMSLESRHADWVGSPFTGESTVHVSVWRKP